MFSDSEEEPPEGKTDVMDYYLSKVEKHLETELNLINMWQ